MKYLCFRFWRLERKPKAYKSTKKHYSSLVRRAAKPHWGNSFKRKPLGRTRLHVGQNIWMDNPSKSRFIVRCASPLPPIWLLAPFMFLLLSMTSFSFTLLFSLLSGVFHITFFASVRWRSPNHSSIIRNYPSNPPIYASLSFYSLTWWRAKLETLLIL